MADFYLEFGGDVPLSPTGGLLLLAEAGQAVEQRLVRRILTNPGDDRWSLDYGMGAPQYIGRTAHDDRIKARILKNMRAESGVDQTKPVDVVVSTDAASGVTTATIKFTVRLTQQLWQTDPIVI